MVCCPYGEVSEEPLCNINGDLKSPELLNRRSTFLEFFTGKSEAVCGTRTIDEDVPRIAEGKEAVPGDWPWMALLGYARAGATEPSFECGGTLISRRNVLTSAHCIDKR